MNAIKTSSIKNLQAQFNQYPNIPKHWLEAYLLFVIKQNKAFLISHDDYVLSDDEYQKWQDGLTQMMSGVPLAYVVGYAEFYGYRFKVDCHTLIPRPDTEILVETVLDFVKNQSLTKGGLLDLGTGSGCIAITLAKILPNFEVVAVDNSNQALKIAQTNAKDLNADNCEFLLSDWFDGIKNNAEHKFDVIVSNPPYIMPNDGHLKELIHEPITALVGQGNGLGDIIHIIKTAKNYLNHHGLLAIEHGYHQANEVQAIFNTYQYKNITTIKDYGGNDRVTLGICDE